MAREKKNRAGTGRRLFKKGQSGNPKGRPKGSPNKVTKEARELCKYIVEDASYQAGLLRRANAGKLHPLLEAKLWENAGVTPTHPLDDPHQLPMGRTPPQLPAGPEPITLEFELVSDMPPAPPPTEAGP